jgi:hypothetical protein
MNGGEVDFLGPAQADVDHVGAAGREPRDQGLGEHRAFQPHVAPEHHTPRAQFRNEGAAEIPGERRVDLLRDPAPDVVGQETGQVGHLPTP